MRLNLAYSHTSIDPDIHACGTLRLCVETRLRLRACRSQCDIGQDYARHHPRTLHAPLRWSHGLRWGKAVAVLQLTLLFSGLMGCLAQLVRESNRDRRRSRMVEADCLGLGWCGCDWRKSEESQKMI